jgi:ABC-type Fe3+-hydroxamate transport system substrate-binding protein
MTTALFRPANVIRHAHSARRRALLGCATAWAITCAVPLRARAQARVPRRVVVMNWELTETLLALGHAPIGIPLPSWYSSTIVAPPLPRGVADTGLLYQPNFEMLVALAPDLMIVTPGHASILPALQRIAPTLTLGAYMSDAHPYARLCEETRAMASAFDTDSRACALIDATAQTMQAVEQRLGLQPDRTRAPVIVAEAIDDRHLRVYGSGSLFDDMLRGIGVSNAVNPPASANHATASWTTNAAGSALVPLQRLTEVSHAGVLLISPLQPDVLTTLKKNPLWRALPAVRERRVAQLPVIAPYGGLVSMQRFVTAVEAALDTISTGRGGLA